VIPGEVFDSVPLLRAGVRSQPAVRPPNAGQHQVCIGQPDPPPPNGPASGLACALLTAGLVPAVVLPPALGCPIPQESYE
jgi:hypothetical protein